MEINSFNSIDGVFSNKNTEKKSNKEAQKITKNQTQMQRNSLSEAIGRSQVSFRGSYTSNNKIFEYSNQSLVNGSEHTVYNNETGAIDHSEYYPNGRLKRHFINDPTTNTKVEEEVEPSGAKVVTTTTPEKTETKKIDAEQNVYYSEEYIPSSDSKYTESIEQNRHRKVVKGFEKGEQKLVEVTDLRTGELVFNGPLVEDKFKVGDGETIIKNIVTGDIYDRKKEVSGKVVSHEKYSRETLALVYKYEVDSKTGNSIKREYTEDGQNLLYEEKCNSSGKVLSSKKFHPTTLKLAEEYTYDPKTKSEHTITYDEDGNELYRKHTDKDGTRSITSYKNGVPTSLKIVSKNSRDVESFKFAEDGETVISHESFTYDKNHKVKTHTIFNDESDVILKRISYQDENNYVETKYSIKSETGNVPSSAKVYQDGKLVKRQKFYEDGYTLKKETEYDLRDNSFITSCYDEYEVLAQKQFYTDKGEMYKLETFDIHGRLLERNEVKPANGTFESTKFNSITGKRVEFTQTDIDGAPIKHVKFYADGKTPKEQKIFNEDGSYQKITYDKYGNVTGKSVVANDDPMSKTKPISDDKLNDKAQLRKKIASLENRVRSLDKYTKDNIPKDELDALSKLSGIKDFSLIFDLEKQQIREVALAFCNYIDEHSESFDLESIIFTVLASNLSESALKASSNPDKKLKLSKLEKEFIADVTGAGSFEQLLSYDSKKFRKVQAGFHPDKYADEAVKRIASNIFSLLGNIDSNR